MTGQGVRWTAEQVLAMAPDEASRRAGSRLSEPGPWREAGADGAAVWGLCEGSGSRAYETVVDLAGGTGGGAEGPGFRCSCPSRKFPCKHALGLLLLWAGGRQSVTEDSEPPAWAEQWLSQRRERAARRNGASASGRVNGIARDGRSEGEGIAEGEDTSGSTGGAGGAGGAGGTGSLGDGSQADAPGDTTSRRRAERRRQRIAAGATDLEERLADLLRDGLAGADQAGYTPWEEIAARMVDAQAPGLAARVRELGAVASSGTGWPERLLSECALLHLLARGYLALENAEIAADAELGAAAERAEAQGADTEANGAEATDLTPTSNPTPLPTPGAAGPHTTREADAERETEREKEQGEAGGSAMPEPLAATVRARVGLTVDTAELLADDRARVRDQWLVLAQRDEEEGRLTARRIWLYGRSTGRPALLLSFGAAGRAPELTLPVGSSVDAELAFYPGARPLRAALGERFGAPGAGFVPPGGTLREALAAYAAALCGDPWLDAWPVVLRGVVPVPGERTRGSGFWQVAEAMSGDSGGGDALPVAPGTAENALWRLTAISGGSPLTVFGECGHRGFAPYTAWSEGVGVQL